MTRLGLNWASMACTLMFFFFSSRRRHTRWTGDWSSDVCYSDLSLVRVIRRAHDALLLHLLDEPRGAVVADAELALDPRDRRVARRRHDVHGLVVHIVVRLAAATTAATAEVAAAFAVLVARLDDVQVVDRAALRLEELDDAVDLALVDVAAVQALRCRAAIREQHVAGTEQCLGAVLVEDRARVDLRCDRERD